MIQLERWIRWSLKALRFILGCFSGLLSDFRQPHEKPQTTLSVILSPAVGSYALVLVTVVTCFQLKERDFSLSLLGLFS